LLGVTLLLNRGRFLIAFTAAVVFGRVVVELLDKKPAGGRRFGERLAVSVVRYSAEFPFRNAGKFLSESDSEKSAMASHSCRDGRRGSPD
jgi:hypothetical protein